MRVLLVNMPWSPIDLPSLALGILKRSVDERVPGAGAEVLHANLEFTDWITERTEFAPEDYQFYSLSSYFLGCGDWVFSSALYDDPTWRDEEFATAMKGKLRKSRLHMSRELHRQAPEFVEMMARRIVEYAPDVVGFTSTFQQNTAALAAAKYVKRLAPGIVTVMGGANCDGEQGEAVHRNFPFVDFVIRGEGEAAFPQLLTAIIEGAGSDELATVPGLCHRDAEGASVVNPMATSPLPPATIARPRLQRLLRAPRGLRGPQLGRAQARRRGRARLLVGREAPLHVLRPQRLVHAVPQQEPRHVLRRDHGAGRSATGARHVPRRQHPRHGLPHHRAAPDHGEPATTCGCTSRSRPICAAASCARSPRPDSSTCSPASRA